MPSTAWKEVVAPDEKERFARYAAEVAAIQKARAAKGGGVTRGFHPKMLAGVRAELEVLDGLPAHARQGLFAQPKKYEAWVRFSNGSVRVQDDRKGDVRGMAVKVLGVPGKKVIAALGDAQTQDLSMIHVPKLEFRNAAEFMWFVGAAQKPLTLVPRLVGRFGLARTLRMLRSLSKGTLRPIPTLAGEQFWSPMAIAFGPYAARYSARPVVAATAAGKPASADYLGEDLAARLRAGAIVYEIEVRFFEDEATTPIEDTSVEWTTPAVVVARLTLVRQDVTSAEGTALAERIEATSFNPWHALEAHRPLGDMMRARDPAYVASTTARGAAGEP